MHSGLETSLIGASVGGVVPKLLVFTDFCQVDKKGGNNAFKHL